MTTGPRRCGAGCRCTTSRQSRCWRSTGSAACLPRWTPRATSRTITRPCWPSCTHRCADEVGLDHCEDLGRPGPHATGRPARRRGHPASICTSVNDEVVHGIPGPRVLESGAIVAIDLGVLLEGFHADVAVTV